MEYPSDPMGFKRIPTDIFMHGKMQRVTPAVHAARGGVPLYGKTDNFHPCQEKGWSPWEKV